MSLSEKCEQCLIEDDICLPIFIPEFVVFTDPFLANDVTLVTSYGYCQSLKINDRRLDRRCTYVRCLSYDL